VDGGREYQEVASGKKSWRLLGESEKTEEPSYGEKIRKKLGQKKTKKKFLPQQLGPDRKKGKRGEVRCGAQWEFKSRSLDRDGRGIVRRGEITLFLGPKKGLGREEGWSALQIEKGEKKRKMKKAHRPTCTSAGKNSSGGCRLLFFQNNEGEREKKVGI